MHSTKQCSHGNSYETVLSQQIVYWSFCTTVNIRVFKRSSFDIARTFYFKSAVFWDKNQEVS